ncbi:RES family NAD+ phosphorylase [Alcaligenes sp. DN25]|uniref:RES family NAD+ phosphorylase n=1 Tax=Alcaligenes TaxID=507 RepID=UPI00202E7919|nr:MULTISPECIES: RES family NAD+ phosphorylase [Alcaligenes]URW83161.1 RES family NAD+ phosphorylase [Alcaligenes sp. DN25]WEA67991.1 RES family NAD+ phosphorylase [Alcaligenes faecalis]
MSFICSSCIGDTFLRRLVEDASSDKTPCEYCDAKSAADLWMVTELCDEVLDTFFEDSSNTMAVVHFNYTPAGEDLPSTVARLTGMPQEAVEAVVESLASLWHDPSSGESRYGDDEPWFVRKASMAAELSHSWREMEESLRSDVRYFNPQAIHLLEKIFGELANDRNMEGLPVVVEAGPGTLLSTFYRARVFQTDGALTEALKWPERLLGSPAAGIGAAGRMNGQGQPAFYGATSPEVCIAEVRPPVGSRVVLAAFDVIRPIRLLDLRRLATVELSPESSLFDPNTRAAAQRRDFLRTLGDRISAPVVPELQDRDYLVTQAVADYLAAHLALNLEGIVYASAQNRRPDEPPAGDNVVLFRKASDVENAHGDQATAEVALWEYEEEGPERWFHPCILYPEREAYRHGPKPQNPTLSLRRDSIVVHDVRAVRYETKGHEVDVVSSLDDRHYG